MQITITGPRGGGATTLAIEIGRILRDKGFAVDFKSRDAVAEKFLLEAMNNASDDDRQWLRSRVVIVEGIEPEDERAVTHRPFPT